MWRPMIKRAHQPVRLGADRIRIGGVIIGIGADIVDPDGWVWALLNCLDGTRTVDQTIAELVHRFPHHAAAEVRSAIEDLRLAGYLEDAAALPPAELSATEQERYSRGHALRGWMDRVPRRSPWDTQMLLRQARVTVVGIGGAGATAALSLVLSGVGQVHCIEPDVVELSNLNRQILFAEADVGRSKLDVALERLRAHNSDITVTGAALTVDGPATLARLAAECDLLVLTADQPREIRSWANSACHASGTAWVHAGYQGPQINVGLYRPGAGPCYDCAYIAARQRRAALPPRTPWAPATELPEPMHAANAVTAGIAGQLAAHAAMSLITGAPAIRTNCEYGLNLVTMHDSVLGLTAPHPDCATCSPATSS